MPGPVDRRLLSPREAATYLGVSFWTIREWVLAGYLPTVDLPALRPREGDQVKRSLRRVLVDRADVDAFIDSRKHANGGRA